MNLSLQRSIVSICCEYSPRRNSNTPPSQGFISSLQVQAFVLTKRQLSIAGVGFNLCSNFPASPCIQLGNMTDPYLSPELTFRDGVAYHPLVTEFLQIIGGPNPCMQARRMQCLPCTFAHWRVKDYKGNIFNPGFESQGGN